jgi:hypothetical protein
MCAPPNVEIVMKESEAFEQQIHRIYELLEGSGAEVTWNVHIPDSDNPSQQRQIDITIRRDGKLTLVECRDHQSHQDVQWVEELIGRRLSLKADKIIGVSSSGFTTGALKKAKTHDVILRDLRQLTDLEVKSWGGRVALTLYFYQYSNVKLMLCFKREGIPRLDKDVVRSELTSGPHIHSLFNVAAKQIDSLNLIDGDQTGRTVDFGFRAELTGFELSGEPVLAAHFHGKAQLISKEVISPAVFAYGIPDNSIAQRDAVVEKFSLGETSIVHEASRISVFLDLSQVEMPPFCQFRFFRLVGQDEMDHEAIELAGLDKLRRVQGRMKDITICSM